MHAFRLGFATTLLGVMSLLPPHASALEVWSGRTFTFSKPDSADWTQPQYQDRLTAAVSLTRAHNRGLFNIAQEDGYTPQFSPQDTEWATGDAADWAQLTFAPWQAWNGGVPPGVVGVDAVVHLISDDIYVDIRFESWTAANGGGGFSYTRATAPMVPVEPVAANVPTLRATPNPFNPATEIQIAVAAEGPATMTLHDGRGRLVRTLLTGSLAAGTRAVRWDGRDDAGRPVGAGTYLVRLQTPTAVVTTRLTLVR